jgi:hypothetical protein
MITESKSSKQTGSAEIGTRGSNLLRVMEPRLIVKGILAVACICGWSRCVLANATTCETDEAGLWTPATLDTTLEGKLRTLFQCIDTSDPTEYGLIDATACNWFVGKSLETAWSFSDFKNGDGYFTANELADRLAGGQFSHWTALGTGNTQEANDNAASRAKNGNPVIAAWRSAGAIGHVALIIPGNLAYSSSWGLNVPRSASISLNDVNSSYIGCRLSNAFSADKKSSVKYYYRDLLPF